MHRAIDELGCRLRLLVLSVASCVGQQSGKIEVRRKEILSKFISKPDKTPFCFPVYSLSHNLVLIIYSENKDFHGYILLEKQLRSLDSFVNLFKRMEGCKKLIICFQSFYSVSVENHSIDKLIPHIKR